MSEQIEAVHELRALTGCGLKVALDYVRAGWRIGAPVDVDLIREHDERQAAKYRLERAAPELLEVVQAFMRADGHDDFEDVWPLARAALSKAIGQGEAG